MRVQSIIRELRGEKIDIIEFSDEAVTFATHALSPAKVSRITILDPLEKHMEVIVDDSQLSLAIGKKGQNVRLAAKLLGWKIDIKSEEEKRQEVESQMAALVAPGAPVSVLVEYGLTNSIVEKLLDASVGTIERLGSMTPEQLEEIQGIGPKMVEHIRDAVNAYYSQFETVTEEVAEEGVQEAVEGAAPEGAAEEAVEEPAAQEETAGEEAAAEDAPAEEAGVAGEEVESPQTAETLEHSGTIEDAGSPTDNPGPEDGRGN
jgi:transcription termination/antitermination protein NusA